MQIIDRNQDHILQPEKCYLNGKKIIALRDTICRDTKNDEPKAPSGKEIEELVKEIESNEDFEKIKSENFSCKDKESTRLKGYHTFIPVYTYHFPGKFKLTQHSTVYSKYALDQWFCAGKASDKVEHLNVLRAASSSLFNEVKKRFQSDFENTKKLSVLSGHDNTIVYALVNLISKSDLKEWIQKVIGGETELHSLIPPFAANLIFELHEEDGNTAVSNVPNTEPITEANQGPTTNPSKRILANKVRQPSRFVKILYNGKELTQQSRYPLNEPLSLANIPFDKFMSMLDNIIVEDFSKKITCEEKKTAKKRNKKQKFNKTK